MSGQKKFFYIFVTKKRLDKQRPYFLEVAARQDAFRPALTPFDVSRTLIFNLLTNGFTLTLFQHDRCLDSKRCLFDCYSPITFISISFLFCLCNLLIIATLHFGQVRRNTAFSSLYPAILYPQFGQYSCISVTLHKPIYALILHYIGFLTFPTLFFLFLFLLVYDNGCIETNHLFLLNIDFTPSARTSDNRPFLPSLHSFLLFLSERLFGFSFIILPFFYIVKR